MLNVFDAKFIFLAMTVTLMWLTQESNGSGFAIVTAQKQGNVFTGLSAFHLSFCRGGTGVGRGPHVTIAPLGQGYLPIYQTWHYATPPMHPR